MATLFITDKASEEEADVAVPQGESLSELSSVVSLNCFPVRRSKCS